MVPDGTIAYQPLELKKKMMRALRKSIQAETNFAKSIKRKLFDHDG
jgi:hypothetical protein